jgi:inhibitor of KinA
LTEPLNSYSLFPLGDSAITLDAGSCIDELHNIRVQAIHDWLLAYRFPGILDIIVAYSSVSVFYDPAVVRASGVAGSQEIGSWVESLLRRGWDATAAAGIEPSGRVFGDGADPLATAGTGLSAGLGHSFRIPVCYEGPHSPDLEGIAAQLGLSVQEVVELHSAGVYRVYSIGFLPGFPYLGIIDQRLQAPRKPRPVPVKAGSVGIAGGQTGIYTLNSPGGWHIIGRTPLRLFDADADPPVRLGTGDRVEFYPVSSGEFEALTGRPL